MARKFILIIFTSIITLVASCSEEKEIKPLTYAEIFSGGKESKTWRVESIITKKEGGEERNYLQLFELCERDDRYTFYDAEERFTITNGSRLCDDEDDVLVDYNWSFTNAGALLYIPFPRIFGYYVIPFIVREATANRLTLFVYLDLENTVSFEITLVPAND